VTVGTFKSIIRTESQSLACLRQNYDIKTDI